MLLQDFERIFPQYRGVAAGIRRGAFRQGPADENDTAYFADKGHEEKGPYGGDAHASEKTYDAGADRGTDEAHRPLGDAFAASHRRRPRRVAEGTAADYVAAEGSFGRTQPPGDHADHGHDPASGKAKDQIGQGNDGQAHKIYFFRAESPDEKGAEQPVKRAYSHAEAIDEAEAGASGAQGDDVDT